MFLRGSVVICLDIDCTGLDGLGGGSRSRAGSRSTSSDKDGGHGFDDVHHFGDLALSIFEILDVHDFHFTLVMVMCKRIVQLEVRMSDDASAKEE